MKMLEMVLFFQSWPHVKREILKVDILEAEHMTRENYNALRNVLLLFKKFCFSGAVIKKLP